MKSNRKLVPKRAPFLGWAWGPAILAAILVAVIVLISIENDRKKNMVAKPSNTAVLPPIPQAPLPDHLYSIDELKAFWNKNLKAPVVDDLMGPSGYHIPEIRGRYITLKKIVEDKYGPLFVNCSPTYADNSKEIAAGCDILNGKPTIIFFMSKMVDIYKELQATAGPDWYSKFQLTAVIMVIHELEHMAEDDMSKKEADISLDELILCEKKAWDRTCRYTIDVLVQKYRLPIDHSNEKYYRAWLATGRSENSPGWENFIREGYRKTRQ